MEKVWFQEEQKFTQGWVIKLLFFILGLVGVAIITRLLRNGSNHDDMVALVVSGVIVSGLGYLIVIARLLTYFTEKGIRYQFFPFHFKTKIIRWEAVEKVYVRKYRPIMEYGGWGIRYGLNGKAYNIAGNYGIQLELKGGKKLLIGTQKPDLIEELLRSKNIYTE